jgi:hypothetical protein
MRHLVRLKLVHEIFDVLRQPYATESKVISQLASAWTEAAVKETLTLMFSERLIESSARRLNITDERFANQLSNVYKNGPNA